jgi:nucleoside-diphosphate-sugar epimerase
MVSDKILVAGALGQIGTDLVEKLVSVYGASNVIAADVRTPEKELSCVFETLDILDAGAFYNLIKKHNITHLYHLAALLSATAEKNPKFGWQLNMDGLFHALDLAKEGHLKKIFWPSSIAVFGPTTPRANTPQYTIMEPTTVYGISKLAGERWCEYYFNKYKVDVRGVRYPGLISYKSLPGGGTTDYAVDIFYEAAKKNSYTCFLHAETRLPMMFMDDAIRATIGIMEAPSQQIQIRSSYNLAGFSFTPAELAAEISKRKPGFEISYAPDFRQAIADSWPNSIDDSEARKHWNWKPETNLGTMVDIMINSISI